MTRTSTVCGSDVERHIEAFDPYLTADFDEIYVANMGPNYAEMLSVYGSEVLPALRRNGRNTGSTSTQVDD